MKKGSCLLLCCTAMLLFASMIPCEAEIALPVGLDLPVPRSLGKLNANPQVLSPDGKWIAGLRGNNVVLLSAIDGKESRTFTGHSGAVHGIAFSPDGKHIATCSYDDSARLWDAKTGEQIRILGRTNQDFEGIAYSPDGRLIAATNDDKNLWVWEADGGEAEKLPVGTSNYQRGIAFSPDGGTIASIGGGSLVLWDAKQLTKQTKLDNISENNLSFSPQGSILATWGGSTVKLRNPATGAVVRELSGHQGNVNEASFSASGQFLVSCSSPERDALVWEVDTGNIVLRLPHEQNVTWAAFLPDGGKLFTYSDGLRMWDMTVLADTEKREAFNSYFDGERDGYARFISMFLLDKRKHEQLPYLGPKAGHALVQITDQQGLTIEAVEVSVKIGRIYKVDDGSLPVNIGATKVNVEPSKLRAIDFVKTEGKITYLKLTPLDNGELSATMELENVTGKFTYGDVKYDVGDIARMSFDFQFANQEAEDLPKPEDAPFQGVVVDVEDVRTPATDIIIGSAPGHQLPIHIGLTQFNIPFKFLREVETLLTPRGGIIVKVKLIGDRQLIGFIAQKEVRSVSGKMAFGDFNLELKKLKSITFR